MSAEKDNFKGKVVFQLSCLRDYVCFWEVVSTTTTPVISIHLNTQSYVDFKPASLLLAEFGVQQTKFIKKSTNFSNPHLPTGYLTTKTASKKIGVEWHSHFCAASRSGHRFDDRNSSFTAKQQSGWEGF